MKRKKSKMDNENKQLREKEILLGDLMRLLISPEIQEGKVDKATRKQIGDSFIERWKSIGGPK